MAVDYSQGQFQYGGFWYSVLIQLQSADDVITLDNNAVGGFEYEASMNGLTYSGSLVYTDNVGKLDQLFKGGQCGCIVYISEADQQDNQEAEKRKVVFRFWVDTVQVLERGQQTIRYRINLVGVNMQKCMANIAYSNYGKQAESCLDIFKTCIVASGQDVDQDSFNAVKSDVNINYITNANDNLFTVAKHLFGKMYSFQRRESSLKFFYYDYVTGLYRLFDMSKLDQTSIGCRTVIISHQQSTIEGIQQPESVDIGSRVDISYVDQVESFRKKRLWDYDMSSDQFTQYYADTAELNNIYTARPDQLQDSSRPFELVNEDAFTEHSAVWNNVLDVYGQLEGCLGARSIILDTAGTIYTRPGYQILLEQDRVIDIGFDAPPELAEEEQDRYSGLEGLWHVRNVHGYIDIQQEKFRQVITLMRSYQA